MASAIGERPEAASENLDAALDRLHDAIQFEIDATNDLDAVQHEGISQNPELERAESALKDRERDLASIESKLERYEDPSDASSDERTFGIDVLERHFADAERKLAEITHTLESRAKRDVLMRLLGRTCELARNTISEDVCSQTNAYIDVLMPDNRIRLQSIDRSLVLYGQEGGSVGETLSVAYAFLATLFKGGDHQLPFVVDSPANPIDLRVRTRVAELIPHLGRQFIAFTISSEREGFLQPLENVAKDDIQYVTLFRAGSSELESKLVDVDNVVRTRDGVLVYDARFFRNFHLDQEAAADAI